MKSICAVGGLVLCTLAAGAFARAPEDFATASASCENGRASARYRDAVDACWGAYESAMTRGDYPAALAAAARGCEKYRRADYCAFLSQLPPQVARGGVVRVGADQAQLAASLRRASALVHPLDVEDGEQGYYMRGAGLK